MAKRSSDRAPGRPGPELNDKDHEFILRPAQDPLDRFGWGPDDIKIEPPKPNSKAPKPRRKKKSDAAD